MYFLVYICRLCSISFEKAKMTPDFFFNYTHTLLIFINEFRISREDFFHSWINNPLIFFNMWHFFYSRKGAYPKRPPPSGSNNDHCISGSRPTEGSYSNLIASTFPSVIVHFIFSISPT